ncbi:response regulator [Flavobacterium sp. '19STA2R22 D10 B1']|uniref:response regulator n=1 Tax=Flavobacterium aerium TaxID=3037261 RepID=UPI00278BF6B4|nr:response regulator [Flavobacterium sp. '19STA2R22 D10 B1']
MLDKVFCIDDDTITLMLYKMVIVKATFAKEIISASNGQEALNYYNKLIEAKTEGNTITYPSLIFLDLNMPIMSGWEFLDHFTTHIYPHFIDTKVIILSSTIDPEDIKKSKQYPMVLDFLSKPITKGMLEQLKDSF